MIETSQHIKEILQRLPEKPGVYQHLNKEGEIIYVGKAKNLKRRVTSYFQKEHDWVKTRQLVKNIADIKYVVVDTEQDAFLLENNFIKQQINEGRQAYIVCPLVEESDEINAKSVMEVVELYKKIFPNYKVEFLHGKIL